MINKTLIDKANEIYYLHNIEAFLTAMEIGTIFMENFNDERTVEWTNDDECLKCALATISLDSTKSESNIFDSLKYVIENRTWENIIFKRYQSPYEYAVYCGFIMGQFFGIPTTESITKAMAAMKIFDTDFDFYYLQDVCQYVMGRTKHPTTGKFYEREEN